MVKTAKGRPKKLFNFILERNFWPKTDWFHDLLNPLNSIFFLWTRLERSIYRNNTQIYIPSKTLFSKTLPTLLLTKYDFWISSWYDLSINILKKSLHRFNCRKLHRQSPNQGISVHSEVFLVNALSLIGLWY